MRDFANIFNNGILIAAVLGWMTAQAIKVVTTLIMYRRFDLTRLIGAGGMPSAHSASVMALAASCGLREGWDSGMFAIALAFAMVVMYDAAGVRRAAGKQAAALNRLIDHIVAEGARGITTGRLKELLGHTPLEVFAGAVLGILIALYLYYY